MRGGTNIGHSAEKAMTIPRASASVTPRGPGGRTSSYVNAVLLIPSSGKLSRAGFHTGLPMEPESCGLSSLPIHRRSLLGTAGRVHPRRRDLQNLTLQSVEFNSASAH